MIFGRVAPQIDRKMLLIDAASMQRKFPAYVGSVMSIIKIVIAMWEKNPIW